MLSRSDSNILMLKLGEAAIRSGIVHGSIKAYNGWAYRIDLPPHREYERFFLAQVTPKRLTIESQFWSVAKQDYDTHQLIYFDNGINVDVQAIASFLKDSDSGSRQAVERAIASSQMADRTAGTLAGAAAILADWQPVYSSGEPDERHASMVLKKGAMSAILSTSWTSESKEYLHEVRFCSLTQEQAENLLAAAQSILTVE